MINIQQNWNENAEDHINEKKRSTRFIFGYKHGLDKTIAFVFDLQTKKEIIKMNKSGIFTKRYPISVS